MGTPLAVSKTPHIYSVVYSLLEITTPIATEKTSSLLLLNIFGSSS